MKRVLDFILALIGLIILTLPLLLLIVIIYFTFGRPVFFRQVRPGMHAIPFEMIKFRTMTSERGEDGCLLPDAMRLTPFGKLMRSTSIDELPELWNVLKGDMSLVGPRPLLMEYLPMYSEDQARRHNVRPGITGWAQVNGRNAICWEEKFKLDIWYVDNKSLWLDIQILLATIKKVLNRDGINYEGESTASKFKGN
jgi:lipopolysaccharide/colanic/teichoic acid biosynthesis glycosyltransferase